MIGQSHREFSIREQKEKKLFVGGVRSIVTARDLKNYFEKFGDVADAVVNLNQFGRPTSGFVIFEHADSATEALKCEQHMILGRQVDVARAKRTYVPGLPQTPSLYRHSHPLNPLDEAGVSSDHPRIYETVNSHRRSKYGFHERKSDRGFKTCWNADHSNWNDHKRFTEAASHKEPTFPRKFGRERAVNERRYTDDEKRLEERSSGKPWQQH